MLQGSLDHVAHDRIWGWAWAPETPDSSVNLEIVADGEVVARCRADRFRQFLLDGAIGNGEHGFEVTLPIPLSRGRRHVVEVRRAEDGAPLPGAPKTLEGSRAFDADAREEFSRLIAAVDTEEDFRDRLDYLTCQANELKAAWARRGDPAKVARYGKGKPRALVLDATTPGGEAIQLLSHMASLQRLGFHVEFACAEMDGDARALAGPGIAMHAQPRLNSVEELLRLERGGYALILLHGATAASCYLALARRLQPRSRVVYAVGELGHLKFSRQGAVEERRELLAHAQNLQRSELAAALGADAVVTSSIAEQKILAKHLPPDRIVLAPWTVAPRPVAIPFAERQGVAFILRAEDPADVDAAHTLIETLMPAVWRVDREIPCWLVGGALPTELARAGPVRIVRRPADLDETFARLRLTVAPLAFGAGVKSEIVASFAAAVPCVLSPLAAEGLAKLPAVARQIAPTVEDFARIVAALHGEETLNAEVGQASLAFAREAYSVERVDAALARAAGVRRHAAQAAIPNR